MPDLFTLPLRKVDRPLKIHSKLLAADLWLVPTGNTEEFDAPTYSLEECRLLLALDLSPAELKAVHLTKKLFQGDLELAGDLQTLKPIYRRLFDRYREIESRYDAGERDLEAELLKRCRQLNYLLTQVSQLEK
ncbi:MAG TPA: hypothetical protein EYG11_13960 [Candidatus Latescibacteria bacterium]|nr:hypothetical protein [Candidatus Handelsmanbacteria bacterium]HIL09802.1 hypothetical protein [Candidatus Latescibacterota bacterium]